MSPKAEGEFVEGPRDFHKLSRDLRDIWSLISRNDMLLLCNSMVTEEKC